MNVTYIPVAVIPDESVEVFHTNGGYVRVEHMQDDDFASEIYGRRKVTMLEHGLTEQALECLDDILEVTEAGQTPTWSLECDCGCGEDLMFVRFLPAGSEN